MTKMLHIHNNLTRRKEPFTPIEPGKVGLYVCGMTVYDLCHLGHARVMVVFDTVVRWLRASGYAVTYVRNITDIDDKIIKRAAENGEAIGDLTARFIAAMHEDADRLGCLRPDHEPRATENVEAMLAMIAALKDKGLAYVGDNGDVYYDVSRFEGYGKLSGRDPNDLRAGERVAVNEAKDDPLDFVLWKAAKPGEPAWDSPWGPGRPGWHIECSAMSMEILGKQFDIHGGGLDLQFPHHENEIAQSEGCTGKHWVNYWMHNGFVRVDDEKMSKSLGNFFTVREVLARYRPEDVRFFILNSHYRSPLNYADDQLDAARAAVTRLYTALRGLSDAAPAEGTDFERRFTEAMDDDFNTPVAIAALFDLAREINRAKGEDTQQATALGALLVKLGGVLGLLQSDPDKYLKGHRMEVAETIEIGDHAEATVHVSDKNIERLIAERTAARKAKDWAESDRIRDKLKSEGVVLEDGPQGTTWRRE